MKIDWKNWRTWAYGGGAVGLLLLLGKGARRVGLLAFQAVENETFRLSLPGRAQPYADAILQVSEEEQVSPFLIFALGDRESGWGRFLTPPDPSGTGDGGHGRGLLQIDDRSHAAWLDANDWTDPLTNISYGIHNIFVPQYKQLQAAGLTGAVLEQAAVSAYNHGVHGVLRSIQATGNPDAGTTQGNYGSDVLARAATAASNYGAA